VPKALVAEFPGLFAGELSHGREDAAFNRHLSMKLIVFVESTQSLDG
jgi:hypothetical protein